MPQILMRLLVAVCVCTIASANMARAQGIITTVAGGGPQDQSGVSAAIQPSAVAADAAGNIYIALTSRHRVVKLDATGH